MVLCFAASVESSAYTGSDYSFTKNGLYYKIIDGQNVRLVPGLQEPTGDVTVPYRVTNNSTTYYVSELDAKTFQNLTGLTSVTFSTGTTSSMANKITVIPAKAFYNCINLTKLKLPTNLTTIGEQAFYFCRSLKSNGTISSMFDLPSTLTSIGISAFYNTAITRIVIPTGCTVGWGAFYNCDAIVHLTTNDKITKFDDCFGNLPNIQNLNLASGITSIPEGWFMNHTALKEVQFASDTHMTELPKNLFKGCTGLTKVTLPYTVTTIGQNAFSGCTSITSINLDVATWLRTIPSQCFYGCSAMTAFSVPDFVTTVGSKAFGNMTALAEVSLGKGLTAATLATDAFDGSNNITKLTLDCNDIVSQSYQGTANLLVKYGFNKVETLCFGPNIKKIGDTAFERSQTITGIEFAAEGLEAIEPYAFFECKNLETIGTHDWSWGQDGWSGHFPSTLKTIGDAAFLYCERLSYQLYLTHSDISTIGRMAFYGTRITMVEMFDDVTEIGEGAFWSKSLKKIRVWGSTNDNRYSSSWDQKELNCIIDTQSNKVIADCENTD
ncbi:MAG: leucine-rich repeat domain-containing protein [Prevotella sp.]|nr:leucine-rich repeat domain-containing protein [Prevotella sp.]